MIHFAIGTKAQFIKMAPAMHLLQKMAESYHVLDLSQHGSLTGEILKDFDLDPVITHLGEAGQSVETYFQAVRWLSHGFAQAVFRGRDDIRRGLFRNTEGIVLLHGDTLSTLLGLYLAKSAGLRTALVEAGLTSGHLFDPFPEEAIRRYVSRRADYLFAPDAVAETWLHRHRLAGHIVNTGHNTGRDALYLILQKTGGLTDRRLPSSPDAPALVTLHRLETLGNGCRLRRVIEYILAIADKVGPLHFYMHPPTENALRRHGLLDVLKQSKRIALYGLVPYPVFVRALVEAPFVLTDGGSIQEEASYLNKPCLILRNRTERYHGLGMNAILCTWNVDCDVAHLANVVDASVVTPTALTFEASQIILKTLRESRVAY